MNKALSLGPRIKQAIKWSPYDVVEIAERFDTTKQTIYRWIREENRPSVDDLVRLAELTDRPVAWFFGPTDGIPAGSVRVTFRGKVILSEQIAAGEELRISIG